MNKKIRVAILDDHQSIIDGYRYRFDNHPQIEVVSAIRFGEELEPALKNNPADVLLLDVTVPTSAENPNPYPILHLIPKLLQIYDNLNILVISMHAERGLIRAVMEAGASGYILKDDQDAIQELANTIPIIAVGGRCFSKVAHSIYSKTVSGNELSPRQSEVLSLCMAYPDMTTAGVAKMMNISHSTARNLLSEAYTKMDVHSLHAAIAKARRFGLITPNQAEAPQ